MSESKKGKLVSIIVPVYNVEKYLGKCLDSILAQDFTDYEVILINDGSKDSSGAICDEYARNNGTITVYHKENGGPAGARNLGIENAHGKYLAFVDSDDEIEPGYLRKLTEAITLANAQAAVCGIKYVYLDERPVRIVNNEIVAGDCLSSASKFFEIERAYAFNPVWNKLYEADLVKQSGIRFDDEYGEDVKFNIELFTHISEIAVVSDALYRYNKRSIETLVTKYYPNLMEQVQLINSKRRGLFDKLAQPSEESAILLANLCMSNVSAGIYNLYKKDNKETSRSRLKVFKEILTDGKIAQDMSVYRPQNQIAKIFKTVYKIGSPVFMLLVYASLFFVRNGLAGMYMKVRKWLG